MNIGQGDTEGGRGEAFATRACKGPEKGALIQTVSNSTLLYIYTNVTQFALCSEHCTA